MRFGFKSVGPAAIDCLAAGFVANVGFDSVSSLSDSGHSSLSSVVVSGFDSTLFQGRSRSLTMPNSGNAIVLRDA
jgi:hypothetical protein